MQNRYRTETQKEAPIFPGNPSSDRKASGRCGEQDGATQDQTPHRPRRISSDPADSGTRLGERGRTNEILVRKKTVPIQRKQTSLADPKGI